ncbi:MAG: hypothetical protein QW655_02640 [Nitrososphaerota archaeon]|nr:hypothetical protein [Candidatus Geocrenenecus dongiae]
MQFSKMWFFKKRKEKVEVVQPLSKKIDESIGKLEVIRARLENRVKMLEARNRELFEAIVKAQLERDRDRAVVYANELAELRKMLRKAIHSELSLEGVIHRLQTAKDLDELSNVLAPLKEVLLEVGRDVKGIAPELSENISGVIDTFDEVSIQLGTFYESSILEPSLSEEAEKILTEASTIAAERAKSKLSKIEV